MISKWVNEWFDVTKWMNEWICRCSTDVLERLCRVLAPPPHPPCRLWIWSAPHLVCINRWCSTSLHGRWSIAYQLSQGRRTALKFGPIQTGPAELRGARAGSLWVPPAPPGFDRPPAEKGAPCWAEGPSTLSPCCNSLCTAGSSSLWRRWNKYSTRWKENLLGSHKYLLWEEVTSSNSQQTTRYSVHCDTKLRKWGNLHNTPNQHVL